MKKLEEYDKIIFLGGGVMAERLFNQLGKMEQRLIGVIDLQKEEQRKITQFHGRKIQSPDIFRKEISSEDVAVVVAIGIFQITEIVHSYLSNYGGQEKNLFVANPYTSLRFFCADGEYAKDIRIPFSDEKYFKVEKLFSDEKSIGLWNQLIHSKPYENIEDEYEMVSYLSIKDYYYYEEAYWTDFDFEGRKDEECATIFDCGAYIGDSIIPVCDMIPQKKITYYAFEPLTDNANQIRNNKTFQGICKKLEVFEYGVGEKDTKLAFVLPDNGDKEGGRFVEVTSDTEDVLEIKSLDSLDFKVDGTAYIKMDIEGSELSALKGAKKLIKQYHPFLAICLYHRKNDLVEIPLYIKSLCEEYEFYLRGGYHTILWAIPNSK